MNTFHVKQSTLTAMLILAGKKDIRYYINGLLIEWNDKTTKVVATNGHLLGVYDCMPVEFCENFNNGTGSVVIPADAILKLPKTTARFDPVVTFTQPEPVLFPLAWVMTVNGMTIPFEAIDAKYPDWRRITDNLKTTNEPAGYNLSYLNDFEKCGNILAGGTKLKTMNRTVIHQNGNSGALVEFNGVDYFAGVIMPTRAATGSAGALFPSSLTAKL